MLSSSDGSERPPAHSAGRRWTIAIVGIVIAAVSFGGVDAATALARPLAYRSPASAAPRAQAAGEGKPAEVSFGASLFGAVQRALDVNCGASAAGDFEPTGDMHLTVAHSLVSDSARGPEGEVGFTLVAHDLGFTASIQGGTGCEITVPLSPEDFIAKVGHLKVPIRIAMGWRVSFKVSHEVKIQVQSDFRVRVAVRLDGGQLSPIVEASGSASRPTVEGQGAELSTGPVGSVDFHLPGEVVKAGIEGFYPLKATVTADDGCEVSVGVESSISAAESLHFLGLAGERKFSWKQGVERSLYKCPPKDHTPGDGGAPGAGGTGDDETPQPSCTGGPIAFTLGQAYLGADSASEGIEGQPSGPGYKVETQNCEHRFIAWIPGTSTCPATPREASNAAVATPGGWGDLDGYSGATPPLDEGSAGDVPAFSGPVSICLYFYNGDGDSAGDRGETSFVIKKCMFRQGTDLEIGELLIEGTVETPTGQPARGLELTMQSERDAGTGSVTDDQGEYRSCPPEYLSSGDSPDVWFIQFEGGEWYDESSTRAGATGVPAEYWHTYRLANDKLTGEP